MLLIMRYNVMLKTTKIYICSWIAQPHHEGTKCLQQWRTRLICMWLQKRTMWKLIHFYYKLVDVGRAYHVRKLKYIYSLHNNIFFILPPLYSLWLNYLQKNSINLANCLHMKLSWTSSKTYVPESNTTHDHNV